MNKTRLLACPACSRHLRASEANCPFCGAEVPTEFKDAPAPRGPGRRLSRAALYAFGATSLGLATACSGSVTGIGDADGSADGSADVAADVLRGGPAYGGFPGDTGVGPEGGVGPVYGAPADAEPLPDGFPSDGGVGPVYGAPADAEPFDGFEPDASPPDAGEDADADAGGGMAVYGSPPHH
jgi:hypothetical protein